MRGNRDDAVMRTWTQAEYGASRLFNSGVEEDPEINIGWGYSIQIRIVSNVSKKSKFVINFGFKIHLQIWADEAH